MSTSGNKLFEEIYTRLTNEEDSGLCEDLGDKACHSTRRSFVLILGSYLFSKLGDALASPKTTLTWMCNVLGTPAWVIGFLVPVRESGSMLPQLFVGGLIRQLARRKWVWVAGSMAQAAAVAGMGVSALTLEGAAAGWAILVLIALFSLARAFCSVAAKDVLGKTVEQPRRGQLTGWSAGLAGLVTIAVGILLMTPVGEQLDAAGLAVLLIGAGGLWLVAAAIYSRVPEYKGASGGSRSALAALARLSILANDAPFRRFIITRALLMCSALSAPFYVALAQQRLGSPGWLLGAFVAASGFASLVSAPVWGRFADASSRSVMIWAGLITSVTGLVTFALDHWATTLMSSVWFLPVAYFVLSVAHSGVRVGRKTYVVNLGSGNERTDYVAIGNSVIGLLLVMVGLVGALVPVIGNGGVVGLLACLCLVGAVYGLRLPDVEHRG